MVYNLGLQQMDTNTSGKEPAQITGSLSCAPKTAPTAPASAAPASPLRDLNPLLPRDAALYFALNRSWIYFGFKSPVRLTEVQGKFVAFKIEKGESTQTLKYKGERHWPAEEVAKLWTKQHPEGPPANRLEAISKALFDQRERGRWASFGTVLITPEEREKWRTTGDEILRLPFMDQEPANEFQDWISRETPSFDVASDPRYQDVAP